MGLASKFSARHHQMLKIENHNSIIFQIQKRANSMCYKEEDAINASCPALQTTMCIIVCIRIFIRRPVKELQLSAGSLSKNSYKDRAHVKRQRVHQLATASKRVGATLFRQSPACSPPPNQQEDIAVHDVFYPSLELGTIPPSLDLGLLNPRSTGSPSSTFKIDGCTSA
jgi:hypothetical protein